MLEMVTKSLKVASRGPGGGSRGHRSKMVLSEGF